MKQAEDLNEWLVKHASLRGVLACGVRYPDETVFISPSQADFPRENLEYSLRCVADTFQVLKLNQFPNDYVRWIYQNALLYCLKRADGTFLGVFTSRDEAAVDLESLGAMLGEFPKLP